MVLKDLRLKELNITINKQKKPNSSIAIITITPSSMLILSLKYPAGVKATNLMPISKIKT
jgi:hypothetical protein